VLKGKVLPNGKSIFDARPGAEMAPYDFEAAETELKAKYGEEKIRDVDVLSHAIYPGVFEDFMKFKDQYGSMHFLDTRTFLTGLEVDHEVELEIEHGKKIFVKLIAVGGVSKKDGTRDVIFELNGRQRVIKVTDDNAGVTTTAKPKANLTRTGSIGAPMPGVVLEVRVKQGEQVKAGTPLLVLSAMKMETVVAAPVSGKVTSIHAAVGDNMLGGDLLVEIDETGNYEETE
jgi:pyruvate carboxylase